MESGIIKLAPAFTGSAETTAEEMKEYVQGVATRFCGITGLVVLETVDHEKGAFFILGEEGKTQGIVAIGNPNNNYYYQAIGVSRVWVDNTISIGTAFTSNISSNLGRAYRLNAYPIWMKYIKADHGISISIEEAAKPGAMSPIMIIHKQKGDMEEMAMLWTHSSAMYASYNPALVNGAEGAVLFSLTGCNKNIIPPDKEAMTDIYLESGVELPGMRLYTNKKNAASWSKVRIGGTQYILAMKGNFDTGVYSLIMKASDTAAQE